MKKKVSIVIPAFNEATNIPKVTEAVAHVFSALDYDFEIIFIDDGSTDASANVLRQLAAANRQVSYILLSRNFGKDSALSAGLSKAHGDAVITMDADLQHPPTLIPAFLEHWENGNEVVYAYRESKNEHASRMNKVSSGLFYSIINNLSDLELEDGISDFRLLDKKVVDILNTMSEDEPFFRGLIKWIGFAQKGLPYVPEERHSGRSKYNTRQLTKLAIRGITSFSTKPLYIATYLGLSFSLLSLLYIPYIGYSYYFGHTISGWSSIIATIAFFEGLQLMILGIIGLYLGKLFMQSKQRPHYIVKESNLS